MRTRSKLILAALTATILLGLAVSSATARNIEVLNWERGFRITFRSLELGNNVGLEVVRCPVTLEGTFHRHTFAKVARTLIGYITRAIVRGNLVAGECTGGKAAIVAASLPWHVQYASFARTLPLIERIAVRVVGARFSVEPLGSGLNCNARTTDTNPAIGTFRTKAEAGGLLELEEVTASGVIPLEGGGLCALGEGTFGGSETAVTVLGETRRILVKLIT